MALLVYSALDRLVNSCGPAAAAYTSFLGAKIASMSLVARLSS